MKKKDIFWIILSAALVLRLLILINYSSELFWDEYVYIGMGKYIFTWGQLGIWEFIRPLFLPLFLGTFWKLGFPIVITGIALSLSASIGIIFLTYMITEKLRNESEALIASIIIAFTPIFLRFSFRMLTEIYTILFSLLAIYCFICKGFTKSGIFAGLAFMTKFPAGLTGFFLALFSLNNRKKLFKVILPFGIITTSYLLLNKILYNDFFIPFITGNDIIKNSGLWIFSKSWYFYFIEFLKQNPLYLFSILGLVLIFNKSYRIIPIIGISYLIYFSTLTHKEPRFMILFLPYFAILSAYGIKKIIKTKYVYLIVLFISVFVLATNMPQIEMHPNLNYLYYSIPRDVKGEILVSHPGVSFDSPKPVTPIYLPIYNAEFSANWIIYLKENQNNISYVFVDSCEGTICAPTDEECNLNYLKTVEFLKTNFEEVFYEEKENGCKYYVFKNDLS